MKERGRRGARSFDSPTHPLPDSLTRLPLPGRHVAARFAARIIRNDLRRTFRRVVWVGERPWEPPVALPPDRPVVLYSNHHYFHDGYLLWLLTNGVLGRPPVLWMQDWARAPLFGPLGALPFPADDNAARRATVRETLRRLRDAPRSVFLYFPEGSLRPPDLGLGAFEESRLVRMARLLPEEVCWWPVAIRVTWWGEDRPTALLTGGRPHESPDGREAERLAALLERLGQSHPGDPDAATVLMEGRRSLHERWDLSPLAPLFRQWL